MTLHFADIYDRIADAYGDDPALQHEDRRANWTSYAGDARRFATYLASMGVGPDDKVGLLLYNSPEYLIAQYGVFLRRAVPVNINYRYLDDELAYLCNDSGAKVIVAHASLAGRLQRIRSRIPSVRSIVVVDDGDVLDLGGEAGSGAGAGTVDTWTDSLRAEDPASKLTGSPDDVYMLYTGGTTGMPKGVMFRMGDFVNRMFTGYLYRGWTVPTDETIIGEIASHRAAGDRRISIPACPMMHGTGMWLGSMYAHLAGGTVVTLPSRSFNADELWRTVDAVGADAVTIVGDAFARPMLDALDRAVAEGRPYNLSTMRIIQSSGVMWSAEVQTGLLRHLDVRLVDSMGSTEGAMARRIVTRGAPIETARFEPLPGTKLVADDGTIVPRGSSERGRVAASAVVPLGYFNDPVKSAATFVEIDGVRHALAGDWAQWADDGTLILLGRGSNCINTAGEKVFPEEVEEAIKRHPLVVDCLVSGLPDDRFGERVGAVVSLVSAGEATADAVIADVKGWLAGYKLPRTVVIVDRVERAANGKADYGWAKTVLTSAS